MDEKNNDNTWLNSSVEALLNLKYPVLAGYSVDGEKIYVGRSYHKDHLLPAKIVASEDLAYINFNGDEIAKRNYEILCGTEFEWVTCAGEQTPDEMMSIGFSSNKDPLYVGRAHFKEGVFPFPISRSHKVMHYAPLGESKNRTPSYQVLVKKAKDQCSWFTSDCNEPLPAGAVVGGYDNDGTRLYIARACHHTDTLPGKFVPNHRAAYVSWDGDEHAKTKYELLCNGRTAWVKAANGTVPTNAVVGGATFEGEPLYVGRGHYGNSLTPGKVHPSHRTLYIAYGGSEIAIPKYEVLVHRV